VLAFELLFSVLGTAIGLSYIEPEAKDTSTKAAMIVSLFWWLITSLISLFLGSIAAGKLSGSWSRFSASLHGLTVWAGTTLVTLFLLTSAIGAIVGGAFSVIGSSVQAVTSAVGKMAPGIAEKAKQMAPQTELGQISKDVMRRFKTPISAAK
jgi:diacylglycerol kinase